MAQEQSTTSGGAIIQINEGQIKDHPGEIVRGTLRYNQILVTDTIKAYPIESH